MKICEKAAVAAAALLIAGSGALLGTAGQPASAGTSSTCESTLVKTFSLTAANGAALGHVDVYRNSAGKYCAMAVHSAALNGVATFTQIGVRAYNPATNAYSNYDNDFGDYSYYAGPVRVTANCVDVVYEMTTSANSAHGSSGETLIGACGGNDGRFDTQVW